MVPTRCIAAILKASRQTVLSNCPQRCGIFRSSVNFDIQPPTVILLFNWNYYPSLEEIGRLMKNLSWHSPALSSIGKVGGLTLQEELQNLNGWLSSGQVQDLSSSEPFQSHPDSCSQQERSLRHQVLGYRFHWTKSGPNLC